jgi:capsular polysaccharide biosynthesis protein
MELMQFWSALRRRIWIAIALTLVTLLASAAITLAQGISYTATTTLVMSVVPDPRVGDYYKYENIYTYQSGEYLLDDFSEIIRSERFTNDLKAELGGQPQIVKIAGERLTKRTHRLLRVSVTANSADDARAAAEAVARVIEKKGAEYLAQLQAQNAIVTVVDPARVEPSVPPLRLALDFILRGALAFVFGLGIIFLLEYLDSSVRDRKDAERQLGLTVIGEIPRG